jgi:uncharacterized RDD family membrane protein YckC
MDPTAAPPDPAAAERVGFGSRLGAYLIDHVVIWGLGALLARPVSSLFPHAVAAALAAAKEKAAKDPRMAAQMSAFGETMARMTIAVILISAVYFLAEALWGRALGKLILGLRIATDDGRRATPGRLVVRMLVKNGGSVLKLVAMTTGATILSRGGDVLSVVVTAGCLLALWPRRQALHDLAANTAVYHGSDVVSPGPGGAAAR